MKPNVVILDQYAFIGGGQIFAAQLGELCRTLNIDCSLFAPGTGTSWSTLTEIPHFQISIRPSDILTSARIVASALHSRTILVVNGPRTLAIAMLLRHGQKKQIAYNDIFVLHNRPATRAGRVAISQATTNCSVRVSVCHSIKYLLKDPLVIPNCARDKWFLAPEAISSASHDGKVLKFMGRSDPVKGLDLLLSVANKLPPGWHLEVASSPGIQGSRWPLSSVADKRVRFVGQKDASWLQPGDVLCMPSRFEASSLLAAEAKARGALLIASDAWGLGETVRDGVDGLSFHSGNRNSLVDTLHQLAGLSGAARQRLAVAAARNGARDRSFWTTSWSKLLRP